jgi:DMSO/TMAO reductase YedYZ molybdopterin-dependent catalytic subunit
LHLTREHGVVSTSTPEARPVSRAEPGGTPGRTRLACAGLLAGAAGLAASEVASALLRQRLTPRTAVAEAVLEATPGKVAVTLVHLVGQWDKPLLLGGVLLGFAALSAVAGLATGRGLWRGRLLFLLLAVVAAAAVLTRVGADATDLVPVVVGGGTWLLLLPWLVRPVLEPAPGDSSRREFLLHAGIVGAGTVVLAVGGRWVGRTRRRVESARAGLDLPVTDGTPPVGAQVDVADMPPWRTPAADFYRIDTALSVPTIDVDGWRLRVHGMVERELTLSFDDLLARRLTEAWVTLACVSNPVGGDLVGNAWWSGVRIADVLAEARPLAGADAVRQTSADGWDCGTPLSVLTDDRNALLALAMNGEPLPLEHGYPVRAVVPGLYGFVSATKWLVDLEVTRFEDFTAFWTSRGWSDRGPVKTQSRIDVPRADTRVEAGPVRVGGVAWAQHTGIERVEVQLDGGAWQPVDLGRVPGEDTWVQWAGTVDADPGSHTLAVRATDRDGATQTAVRRDVVPDGATGWHTLDFVAE